MTESSREPAALVERRDNILLITLNRPHALNSVNAELAGIVGAAVEQLATEPQLRVGVVTGRGRAFCAGMDLKAFAAGESVAPPGHPEWGLAGLAQHPIDKPLIAAVNGIAMGGGLEIVLACDLAVASTTAVLGVPEVKVGLFPAGGGVFRLPRLIPRRVAVEMMLTGQPVDAPRAYQLGLVNRVVEPDALLGTALGMAATIAGNAPLGVQGCKRLLRETDADGSDWSAEIWSRNDAMMGAVMGSADAQEGARAFAEKRPPQWQGR